MAILWKEAVLRLFHNGFYDVFSPITTERLLIRKLAIGDAEDIFKVSSDPEVSRYVLWDTHRSIADSRSMIRGAQHAYRCDEPASLAIVLRETGHVVGTIGFIWIEREHGCAEIGYSIGRHYWNRGLMTEALHAMLDFGFEKLYLNRIEAQFDVRNPASGRVMQKNGLQREGLMRQRMYNKGEYIDVEMWAILASDYQKMR